MFGSTVLDVAIGLALIFLMLSLVASALREAVEAIVKSRAVQLERGIRTLLDDAVGNGLAKTFYEHPLVYSLYPRAYEVKGWRFRGGNLPSYIPARNFAVALLDMAIRGPNVGPYAAQQTSPALTLPALRASVQRIPSLFVQQAMLSAIDSAQGDVMRVQKNLEEWYDSAMDRVAGQYKRRTQLWLFVIGFGTAVALDVNTLTIADYLGRNEQARTGLVNRAAAIRSDTFYKRLVGDSTIDQLTARAVYEDLQSLKLPIGWDRELPVPKDAGVLYIVRHGLGLLITALAVMLGAPFWFDLLNKFMVIRSTVKPKEKSPDEGSEDRAKEKSKSGTTTAAEIAAAATAAAVGVIANPRAQPPVTPPSSAVAEVADVEPLFIANEWATGDNPQEGII
jgi:hypothetical protein